jgi:hypothetical protein
MQSSQTNPLTPRSPPLQISPNVRDVSSQETIPKLAAPFVFVESLAPLLAHTAGVQKEKETHLHPRWHPGRRSFLTLGFDSGRLVPLSMPIAD